MATDTIQQPTTQPTNGEASLSVPATTKADPEPLRTFYPPCTREEYDRLTLRLHDQNRHDQELQELAAEIDESAIEIARIQGELKEAKDLLKTRQSALKMAVQRRERQRQLPLKIEQGESGSSPQVQQTRPAVVPDSPQSFDPALERPIEDLGAPDGWTEKLRGAGVDTIGKLEKRIRDGKFTAGTVDIKGIGQRAIDKISDCLVAFRKDNPVPDVEIEKAAEVATDVLLGKVDPVEAVSNLLKEEDPRSHGLSVDSSSVVAANQELAMKGDVGTLPTMEWKGPDGESHTAQDPDADAVPEPEETGPDEWELALALCDRLLPRAHILVGRLQAENTDAKAIEAAVGMHGELTEIRQWIVDSEDVTHGQEKTLAKFEAALADVAIPGVQSSAAPTESKILFMRNS